MVFSSPRGGHREEPPRAAGGARVQKEGADGLVVWVHPSGKAECLMPSEA